MYWTNDQSVIEVYYYFCSNNVYYAVGVKYNIIQSHIQVDHIFESPNSLLSLLPADEIEKVALQVAVRTKLLKRRHLTTSP